jgi:hypothetical protein
VLNWTTPSPQRDLVQTYYAALAGAPEPPVLGVTPSLRLYPVDLKDRRQVAFRGVFGPLRNDSAFSTDGSGGSFHDVCGSWAGVGKPPYGTVGLDDFVFDVDCKGRATAVTARGLRTKLKRVGRVITQSADGD